MEKEEWQEEMEKEKEEEEEEEERIPHGVVSQAVFTTLTKTSL